MAQISSPDQITPDASYRLGQNIYEKATETLSGDLINCKERLIYVSRVRPTFIFLPKTDVFLFLGVILVHVLRARNK